MAKNEELVWSRKIEFILSLLSFAVGLGNVWRFPYLCYSNGGGAFLLPYFISLVLIGLPIFYLEISLGQFSSLNSIHCWNIVPAMRGIGYSTLLIAFVLGCYYNIILSLCLQYLIYSWNKVLPWTTCNNSWNVNCTVGKESEQFYKLNVVQETLAFGNYGKPVSNMIIAYFIAWLLVFICLSFSIKTLSKVSYVTAIFPYVMMTILIGKAGSLPGSKTGVVFYLKPNVAKLKDALVWKNAATQIFFSLSTCIGGIITLASHNKFKNNAVLDSIVVSIANCATSFYVGFAVFSTLGYLAHIQNQDITTVATAGFGLAFVTYPAALSKLPVPQLWCTFFFIMMTLLGLGSMLSICEGLLGPLEALLPDHSRKMNLLFRGSVCFISFCFGIPMCYQGGQHLLDVVDNFINLDFVWIGIFESVTVMYIYGLKKYKEDMEYMLDKKWNYYWIVTIAGTAPIFLIIILISNFVKYKSRETSASNTLNIFGLASPVLITFIYLVGYYAMKHFGKLKEPNPWQPPPAYREGYELKH